MSTSDTEKKKPVVQQESEEKKEPALSDEELKQQKEKEETEAKIRALEPDSTNGLAPLSLFDKKPKGVDYINNFAETFQQSLDRIAKANSMDDLVLNSLFEAVIGPLELLTKILKEKQKNQKEAQEKSKKDRENHITDALKAKGLTQNALASRLGYRMQEWLNNESKLARNPDGSIKTKGLSAKERFEYQKYQFAKSLPMVEGSNMYDFTKFTSRQKKTYAKYMLKYAMENSTFAQYVSQMYETPVMKKELQRIINVATTMNLKYNAGLKYRNFSNERAA